MKKEITHTYTVLYDEIKSRLGSYTFDYGYLFLDEEKSDISEFWEEVKRTFVFEENEDEHFVQQFAFRPMSHALEFARKVPFNIEIIYEKSVSI